MADYTGKKQTTDVGFGYKSPFKYETKEGELIEGDYLRIMLRPEELEKLITNERGYKVIAVFPNSVKDENRTEKTPHVVVKPAKEKKGGTRAGRQTTASNNRIPF